jgi:hypothetical protein
MLVANRVSPPTTPSLSLHIAGFLPGDVFAKRYFSNLVILEPWMPRPAIRPLWSKMNA